MEPAIIIHIDGGLVQDVYINGESNVNTAIIIDTDVEGADVDNLIKVNNGVDMAAVHFEKIQPINGLMKKLFEEYMRAK